MPDMGLKPHGAHHIAPDIHGQNFYAIDRQFQDLLSLYLELQPVFPGFDPDALAVCGLDVDRLRREGTEPRDALTRLRAWVLERNRPSEDRPVFVGHNAVFDWSYVAYYFVHFGVENPFGYKGIDSKSLAMGRLGISWNETSKERLERLLALPPQDPALTHRADYDAHYQALILKGLLDRPVANAAPHRTAGTKGPRDKGPRDA